MEKCRLTIGIKTVDRKRIEQIVKKERGYSEEDHFSK